MLRVVLLFEREQFAFDVETATVTAQGSARRDDSVARHDDGDGVPVIRHAHGSAGIRVADGSSDVQVAASFTVWNFKQSLPACYLERGSAKIEREGEVAQPPAKIFVEFAEVGREGCLGFAEFDARRCFLHSIFELKAH